MFEYIAKAFNEATYFNTTLFAFLAAGVCFRLAVYLVVNYTITAISYIYKGVTKR